MQNQIKREIVIQAKKERIYEAIADPKKVVLWFPETLEGAYTVGEQPVLGFGDHGKNQIYIVDARPYDYFAFRWVPGANQFLGDVLTVANTLVEFHIQEDAPGTCSVTLTESGFADLPEEVILDAIKQNSTGWDFMLKRLNVYFERT